QITRTRGTSVIAFSTDSSVAGRGVYLLSFLPESDVNRIVDYSAGIGKKSFAALLPDNAYGNVVEAAFKQAAGRKGRIVAFEKYASDRSAAARTVAQSLGSADVLFIADDGESVVATADALTAAGANLSNIQLLGTGLWDNPRVYASHVLQGGLYAAPDPSGFRAFSGRYRAKYGADPVRTATLAYDAVALVAALSKQGAQRFAPETLGALLRQRGDERDRVIGQRCGAHRVGAVFGAVAAGEGAEARRIRRCIEPALQHVARIDARIVPQPGAEQLDVAQVRARRGQGIRRCHDRIAVVGDEQHIRRAERLRHRPRRRGTVGGVFLEGDDAPLAADRLLEGCFHHIAVGIVRQQRRERFLSDAGGIIDDPVDVGFGQEAEQIDATSGHARIGRERDHRNAARARQLRGRRHRGGEQRAQNDFRALAERLLGHLLGALRTAAVILDQKLDVRTLEFRQRHLGRVLHRLR